MEIEEYKFRHGIKKLPMWFYFQGMAFYIFPVAIVVGIVCRVFSIPFWIGASVITPWAVFWGLKAFKKYVEDRK